MIQDLRTPPPYLGLSPKSDHFFRASLIQKATFFGHPVAIQTFCPSDLRGFQLVSPSYGLFCLVSVCFHYVDWDWSCLGFVCFDCFRILMGRCQWDLLVDGFSKFPFLSVSINFSRCQFWSKLKLHTTPEEKAGSQISH